MLPESLELIIVTPERQLLRERVVEVTIPGLEGALGILPGHAPLMTELGIGELSYRLGTSSQPISIAVIRGFAEVLGDRVIDLARAEAAKARAEQRLASNDPNIDWDRATVALQRSLIRIQIAKKHHSVPSEAR